MQIKNTTSRYGLITKLVHWTVFLLFLNQYVVARLMLSIEQGELALGFSQGTLYNWHKSIGLITLAVVAFRYTWRKTAGLPDWAATLTARERRLIHYVERVLYFCMFAMPISGYLFVMLGGFGVMFFSAFPLPNFLGENETLAWLAQMTHRTLSYVILVTLTIHIGLGLKHQFRNKDRYLNRMLPFTHQ